MQFRRCHARLAELNPHPHRRQGTGGAESSQGGGGVLGGVMVESSSSMRELFRALLCTVRGPGPPPPIRYDTVSCRGCLLPSSDLSADGASDAPGMSSATMTSAGGGGGREEPTTTTTPPSSSFTIVKKMMDNYRKLEEGKETNAKEES